MDIQVNQQMKSHRIKHVLHQQTGQVLAVLALDRGDKSLSTPEDSLPVGKLGTSLSRPCHTLPCRLSLIGLAPWRMQPTSVTTREASTVS
ncbi:hypothetical protein AMECASPLE_038034 [Ameca splendens]|uniref:Uncharacterized protein n=1 Tax=Ameca splendens TaxID=208324 RepID=A0ABV0ZGU2_9TELE